MVTAKSEQSHNNNDSFTFRLDCHLITHEFPGQWKFPEFQILTGPEPQELQPGHPTSLDCHWTAPTPPEVTWSKDGVPLDLTSSGSGRLLSNGSLLLSGERNQAGIYQCSITVDSVGTLLSSPARVVAPGQYYSQPSLESASQLGTGFGKFLSHTEPASPCERKVLSQY